MRASIGLIALSASLVLPATPAFADGAATGPALGVARISIVQGDVAVMRGDSGDWIAATANMPVVEGDSLQVGTGARAEIQLAYGNFVRLGSDTEVQFLELAEKRFRLSVLQGKAIYSELPGSEADIDIETPMAAVRPMKAGRYVVSVLADATYISVMKGKTEVAFQVTSRTLESGRTMIVRSGTGGAEFEVQRSVPMSELDDWAASRDKEARQTTSYQYVSRDISGAGQLDQYGEWRYVPGRGNSWFPYVTISWTPYRHGNWIWLDYYGWSWVGAEPWGWAPYHWGRWYRHNVYGWGWYPGAPGLRHVWRPALVAFFGHNPLLRQRAWDRFGGIAWCPLAPGETYVPWYGQRLYSGAVRNAIVVDNSVRIYNRYSNARGNSGVSYVEASNFGRGASQAARSLRTGDLGAAVAIRGPVPVVPDRASQGRLLQARASRGGGAALTSLRRTGSSTLRDGTTRVPFDDQRNRIRASVDEFRSTYRPAAAAIGSNSRVRASVAGGTAAGSSARSGVVSTPTDSPRSSTAIRSIQPTDGIRPGVGSSASTRVSVTSGQAPAVVFAPRTRSRTGASVRSAARGTRESLTRSSASRNPAQVTRPSALPRASVAARTQGGIRSTPGTSTSVRTSRASTATRSTVYTPRNRSRVGTSSTPSSATGRSSNSRASTVYTPRTSSRGRVQSQRRSNSGRGSSPSYFPSTRSRSSGSSGGGYRGSSYPSARSSSRSSGSSSSGRTYGGGSSSRGSYPSSSSRSSSSSSRSSSSGSFGSRSSSSSSSSSSRSSSSGRSASSSSSSRPSDR